jgi:hypothetical protein
MDKRIALIASVKGREQQLKLVIKRVIDQVDTIHLVLNYYDEVPQWVDHLTYKIVYHLNPTNKNAHDSIWEHLRWDLEFNKKDAYYFICDDDLYYPEDYFDKFIEAIERHNRKSVITAHGSDFVRPVSDYYNSRITYGFTDFCERDIFVQLAGCGTVAFHSSAFNVSPTLQDFPIPFCRDLYFSIFCAKQDVKIVSLQRPAGWIIPLKTEGDTVWDTIKNNKQLRTLKNRVLKEQLLPLLFCDKDNDRFLMMTDYDFDRKLLDKSLITLNQNVDCNKIIFSNNLGNDHRQVTSLTQYVTEEEFNIGRMGSKILTQYRFAKSLPDGSKIISADADLYYLKNPFEAFDEFDFDIGLTTRHYKYRYSINAGVVMFNMNNKVRRFLDFAISQIYERTWQELDEWQERFKHSGNDWYIDQDLWCVAWGLKNWIKSFFDVKIIDIGSKYNYCPHADGIRTELGKQELMQAYNDKSVNVLHLKSKLKELVIDGSLS